MAELTTRRGFLLRAAAASAYLATFGPSLRGVALAAPGADRRVPTQDLADGPHAGPFTGAPRPLPASTTHLGLHWRGEARHVAAFAVRLHAPSTGWSDWMDLAIDEVGEGREETFAALVDARGADQVQYRAGVPANRRLDRVTITAISADGAAAPSASAAASASFATLDGRTRPVIRREDWGCDESLRFDGSGALLWPEMFVPVKKVVVHHTATSNNYADGAAEVRAIYTYHARTQGWGDIGYQTLVDRFGNVYEGRRGRGTTNGAGALSGDVVAGHTLGHNYGATGVAVLGDFTRRKVNTNTDRALLAALDDVTVYECGRAGLKPDASSAFLRSDDAWHASMPAITGHKDSDQTVCPGTSLHSYVTGTLRKNATARLAPFASPTVVLSGPDGVALAAPASLVYSWSGAARHEYWLEGWRRLTNANGTLSEDVEYRGSDGTWSRTEPVRAWTSGSSATFAGLPRGHYTIHVRGYAADGRRSAVEATKTVLVR